jgi:hypothetical protein
MKSNRKTDQCRVLSDRLFTATVALLLAISLADSATGKETSVASTSGTMTGTLSVNGKEIKLKYVYARERDFGTPEQGEVIDLFFTNQPMTEEMLTDIRKNQYRGSDKLRGIRLTVRPGKLTQNPQGGEFEMFAMGIGIGGDRGEPVVSGLLDQEGLVYDSRSQSMLLKEFKTENGRVTGKAQYKGEDGIRTTIYSITFDAPLTLKSSEDRTNGAAPIKAP